MAQQPDLEKGWRLVSIAVSWARSAERRGRDGGSRLTLLLCTQQTTSWCPVCMDLEKHASERGWGGWRTVRKASRMREHWGFCLAEDRSGHGRLWWGGRSVYKYFKLCHVKEEDFPESLEKAEPGLMRWTLEGDGLVAPRSD